MDIYNTYQTLIKPNWAPPAWLFGPVWTVLYIIIAISFGKVFWMAAQKEISLFIALPFALNLIFNFSFTYFQFGLKNNTLAAIDILLVLATLIWAMLALRSLGKAGGRLDNLCEHPVSSPGLLRDRPPARRNILE